MKTLKLLLLISLFASTTAFATTPSKIHGSWTTGCEADGGMGTKHEAIISDDGKMLATELTYDNKKCEGNPTSDSSKATYTILSETTDTVVIDANFALAPDVKSFWSSIKLQFKFRNAEAKIVDVTLHGADDESVNNVDMQTFYKTVL